MRRTPLLLLAATLVSCTSDADRSDFTSVTAPVFVRPAADHFHAHASGREEVPPNTSRAQGQAQFRLSDDGETLHYRLIVANIMNVTQAHIHRNVKGMNGPIVAWLYPSAPPAQLIPGRTNGVLAEGTITAADLVGPLAGQDLDALLDDLRSGRAYVNVHTLQFPPGEIRGQIR